ncbi:MAG: hypothetical protein WCP39_00460 [Chlamydiota bacterium]
MRSLLFSFLLAPFIAFGSSSIQEEFVGTWEVTGTEINSKEPKPFSIELQKKGIAISNWGKGEKGKWKIVGERAEIRWNDGWIEFIYKEGHHYKKIGYAPGSPLDGVPTNESKAKKIKTPNKKW